MSIQPLTRAQVTAEEKLRRAFVSLARQLDVSVATQVEIWPCDGLRPTGYAIRVFRGNGAAAEEGNWSAFLRRVPGLLQASGLDVRDKVKFPVLHDCCLPVANWFVVPRDPKDPKPPSVKAFWGRPVLEFLGFCALGVA